MSRITALAASALLTFPGTAGAEGKPTLLDLFSPERIVLGFLQSGIVALRSQVDIQYGASSVDIASGRVVLTDVSIWPLPDWDAEGDCVIGIDRLTLRTTPLDRPDLIELRVQVAGASAGRVCLPPDARAALDMAGLDGISVPRASMDLAYGVPGSDAEVKLYATVDGAANVSLAAVFSYVGLDGRDSMEDPEPVVFVEDVELTIENLGLWEAVRGQLPPALSDPGSAALLVEGGLGSILAEMNRSAAPPDASGDTSALGDGQRAFLASAVEVWPAFLADPERIVLETWIDGNSYVDFAAAEEDPRYIFDTLMPRLALAPARMSSILPADLVRGALDAPDTLGMDDRLAAGLAFASGTGAPRNLAAAERLLADLAEAGDGAAAMALSDALLRTAPREAYRWALLAGAAGEAGATARLDRIEADIGLAGALDLQAGLPDTASVDPGPGLTIEDIRVRAARHLTGNGAPRSYAGAVLWATIGAAAGDPEASDILEDLDARARYETPEGRAAWAALETEASGRAVELWLALDLPARFRP